MNLSRPNRRQIAAAFFLVSFLPVAAAAVIVVLALIDSSIGHRLFELFVPLDVDAPDNWAVAFTRIMRLIAVTCAVCVIFGCIGLSIAKAKWWPAVAAAAVAVLLAAAIVFQSIGDQFERAKETTNIAFYRAKLDQRRPSGLVDHFPATVPASASAVRFSECASFLQGQGWIQLRLQLPSSEVSAIEAFARGKAARVYPGGGDSGDHLQEKNGWPTARWHTGNGSEFPATFTFYVFNATDLSMGSWDQFECYGIAVSASTNEVVYWATP